MPKKRNTGAKYKHGKMRDDTWTWIEGRRGKVWLPLYCFRELEGSIAESALKYIEQEQRTAKKMKDGLEQFAEFRLHRTGVWLHVEATMEEVRNITGGYALSRLLYSMNRCGKVHKRTGSVCLLAPGHQGNHSPKLPKD